MPQALPVPVRQAVLRRWQHGQTAAEIAAALALPARTIRHLIRTFRHASANDPQALAPAYPHCGWHRSWNNQLLRHDALQMRWQHPGWGAGLIRVLLGERWQRQPLPSERTLQRWFQREGLGPAPRGRRPRGPGARAQRPHEVWQMDAVEQIPLQNKQRACWLRITDEFTGAVLHTKVMPVGRWSSVGAPAVQAELRKAFAHWGRPEQLRVDNGTPWGATGGLPTPLALWVIGLEVVLTWNHPCRPRENAVVERTQGVSERWVEPHTCASAQQLQRRLDKMDRIHRENYPSIAGRSRMQAIRACLIRGATTVVSGNGGIGACNAFGICWPNMRCRGAWTRMAEFGCTIAATTSPRPGTDNKYTRRSMPIRMNGYSRTRAAKRSAVNRLRN
jgi:hypothetical protein